MAETADKGKATAGSRLWKMVDGIQGDKVVWMIVLLLFMISILAIFSSTPLLSLETRVERLEIMKSHGLIAAFGLMLIIALYKMKKIGLYRFFAQFGFLVSFMLLFILDLHINLGFIKAQHINGAWRNLIVMGFQVHVYEVVKVAMVMYLAWACHAYAIDRKATGKGEESPTFIIANMMAKSPRTAFMGKPLAKRITYIYGPALLTCAMVAPGSNSSAIFIALVLVGTMLIGNMPWKEIVMAGLVLVVMASIMLGIHVMTDGKFMPRLETFTERLKADYSTEAIGSLKPGSKEYYDALDAIRSQDSRSRRRASWKRKRQQHPEILRRTYLLRLYVQLHCRRVRVPRRTAHPGAVCEPACTQLNHSEAMRQRVCQDCGRRACFPDNRTGIHAHSGKR